MPPKTRKELFPGIVRPSRGSFLQSNWKRSPERGRRTEDESGLIAGVAVAGTRTTPRPAIPKPKSKSRMIGARNPFSRSSQRRREFKRVKHFRFQDHVTLTTSDLTENNEVIAKAAVVGSSARAGYRSETEGHRRSAPVYRSLHRRRDHAGPSAQAFRDDGPKSTLQGGR